MANNKIRANILGKDANLLKNVAKRVVQNRPADVKYFTELKDFLTESVNDKPDIVAISVNLPHKSAGKLPKVLKMALNIPVIVFGEDQTTKTRKELSVAKADFTIPGVLTAHNFWMKLVNFQKQQEKIEAEAQAAINEMHNKGKTDVNTEIDNVDHFGSLNKDLDNSLQHVMGKSDLDNLIGQDENSIIDSLFSQMGSETPKNKANIISSKNMNTSVTSSSHLHWDAEESQLHSGSSDQGNSLLGLVDDQPSFSHIQGSNGDLSGTATPSTMDDSIIVDSKEKNKKSESGQGYFEGVDPVDEPEKQAKEKEKDFIPEYADPLEPEVKAPEVDEKGRVKLTGKDELAKREQEKDKVRKEKDAEKAKSALEESTKKALKSILFTKSLEEGRTFETTQLSVFTIEGEDFKGFLMFTESFNQGFESYVLEDIRSKIIDNMKSKGYPSEISPPYAITIPTSDYIEVVKQACDFTLFEEDEMGKQIIGSFLEREVVQPQYEDSDKEGMINVDMKTIPPQTPVNFDAFIYLPRNKRFVRYFKDGRSLSLKQVKRHIEGAEPCKLYLPKTDKGKLIQFFIQNTISWEFISHAPAEEKESA